MHMALGLLWQHKGKLFIGVLITVIGISFSNLFRGTRQSSEWFIVYLESMIKREDLHMARIIVSDIHDYRLNANGEIVEEGGETVKYVSVSTVDASLPVSKIRTDRNDNGLVICLPPIDIQEAKIQEELSFLWDDSRDFPKMDIEQKMADATRRRAELVARHRGIEQQAEEAAKTFFSQLSGMSGESARVEFCEESLSPLAES